MKIKIHDEEPSILDTLERCIRLRIRYDSTTIGERNFLRSLLVELQIERDKIHDREQLSLKK